MKYGLSKLFASFKHTDRGFLLACVPACVWALAEGVFSLALILSLGLSVIIGLMKKD
ncbi:MAG: hypothetical protein IIW34_07050 [Clostridia bacterium]|nr:hypothetical protein [Clostridia bacterium]MBQ2326040.1 hypothetical protein [Clostridia bacterium]MBQ5813892.1 hypothetical protein [Clostridia bacterium]